MNTSHFDFDNFDKMIKRVDLARAWLTGKDKNSRWDVIRAVYDEYLPDIMSAAARNVRMSPYMVDWSFTPIEFDAWQDIRRWGLPFFPQFPVGQYFLDLADPYKKIGIELDGKDYHDEAKDRKRDADLWRRGWRIFRAPGKQCKKAPWQPFDQDWKESLEHNPYELREKVAEWSLCYSEGLIWSIGTYYYPLRMAFGPEYLSLAEASLDAHRYERFPLSDDPEDTYGSHPIN